MKNKYKKIDSCVRVLELLKMLINNDINIKDLKILDDNTFFDIEAYETLLKYVATIEFSGIKVKKIDKKYSINSTLSQFKPEKKELDILVLLYKLFDKSCVECYRDDLNKFYEKILKSLCESDRVYLNKAIEDYNFINASQMSQLAQKYQNLVDLGQKLKICYNDLTIVCEPRKVFLEGNNIYLTVYNIKKAEMTDILINKIQNIEILPIKNSFSNITKTVIFKVRGRLANNYRLREHEKVQDFNDEYKIIVNYGEDEQTLIRRLLRYGNNCKIISPVEFKEEFLNTLQSIKDKLLGVN